MRASLPKDPFEGPRDTRVPRTWGSKSWSSRKPTRKHLSLAKFLNRVQNSSTFTWLKSESSMSAFKATTETLSTGLSTCSDIRFLSSSLKKSSNDFPPKPPTFGAVWRSIDESWPESLRATSPLAPHSRLASQKMRWLQLQLFATPCCHYMVKENKKETTRRWAKWFERFWKNRVKDPASILSLGPARQPHHSTESTKKRLHPALRSSFVSSP